MNGVYLLGILPFTVWGSYLYILSSFFEMALPTPPVMAALMALLLALYTGRLVVPPHILEPVARWGVAQFERNRVPDPLARWGTRMMLADKIREQRDEDSGPDGSEAQRDYMRAFVADLKQRAIAEQTDEANVQHYEVDTRFYNLVLGKHRKYSSALYPSADTPVASALDLLDDAEDRMLRLYAERARITTDDAFRVMDLGCGWGSVTLWFAQRFPKCTFVGVSNSKTQRQYILAEAKKRGLDNVDVITGDITHFQLPAGVDKFDRVLSIEMMEHLKHYELLLRKISQTFLKPRGLLFVHIFVHRTHPYHFTVGGTERDPHPADWMAQHFFRGGTMPADDLLLHFQEDVHLVDRWRVNGRHYSLTLEAWLQQMDLRHKEVDKIFAEVYGEENVTLWTARWRAFFFVCSELFKYNEGREWFVSHYLFQNGE